MSIVQNNVIISHTFPYHAQASIGKTAWSTAWKGMVMLFPILNVVSAQCGYSNHPAQPQLSPRCEIMTSKPFPSWWWELIQCDNTGHVFVAFVLCTFLHYICPYHHDTMIHIAAPSAPIQQWDCLCCFICSSEHDRCRALTLRVESRSNMCENVQQSNRLGRRNMCPSRYFVHAGDKTCRFGAQKDPTRLGSCGQDQVTWYRYKRYYILYIHYCLTF